MENALTMLKEQLVDAYCITSYAAVARDLYDEEQMRQSLAILEGKTNDFQIAESYAITAMMLKDRSAIEKAKDAARPRLNNPKFRDLYVRLCEVA